MIEDGDLEEERKLRWETEVKNRTMKADYHVHTEFSDDSEYQMEQQVRSMHSLIRVWFLNPSQLSNSQYGAYSQHWYIHQCCCVVDCILQILFSS